MKTKPVFLTLPAFSACQAIAWAMKNRSLLLIQQLFLIEEPDLVGPKEDVPMNQDYKLD